MDDLQADDIQLAAPATRAHRKQVGSMQSSSMKHPARSKSFPCGALLVSRRSWSTRSRPLRRGVTSAPPQAMRYVESRLWREPMRDNVLQAE